MIRLQDKPEQRMPRIRVRSTMPASRLEALILSALRASAVPLSAYAIADQLRDEGTRVVVPSVYRALRRLGAEGVVEKVEMLSAYRISEREKHLRLVCLNCGQTTGHLLPELYDMLIDSAAQTGFAISKVALELAGRCASCRDEE